MAEALLSPPLTHSVNRSDGFQLLCACARVRPVSRQVSFIAHTDYSSFDWKPFLQLAEHHGMLPLVARNVTKYARELPVDARKALLSSYETNLRKNLWFAAELARILEPLDQRRIPAIAYKGPVLAESAYGDLGLRSFSDLDLLILPADFMKATHALAELGYNPSQELTPALERFFLRTGYERSFDCAARKNLLELQWALLPRFYAVNFESAEFTIDHLLSRANSREVCGRSVPCLSPEDSLLALCLHAAKHLWTRLIWVADIAHTLDSQMIDMPLVISRAKALGIRRILAVSLCLSNQLLGMTIPAEAQPMVNEAMINEGTINEATIGEDSDLPQYVERCISRMAAAATYNLDSAAYFKEIAMLRERPVDRLRYLWRLCWTPSAGDIAAVKLPETLFPLYHGVRAARLLGKLA